VDIGQKLTKQEGTEHKSSTAKSAKTTSKLIPNPFVHVQ
jgi:hypothetical protein